jgi:hypothetical protein
MVSVAGGGIGREDGSGAAHSLQNLESGGLSVWQEGHFMAASLDFPLLGKSISKDGPPGQIIFWLII